ncbi:prostaglandin E2 receptor EP2 subtype-like [Haliotis asinina]|uniref:prostaglandin E2 receptor EP2 subtype-like n=1 Tax=Haliotis asinina TaxID=109174 RepID=UPI0035319022
MLVSGDVMATTSEQYTMSEMQLFLINDTEGIGANISVGGYVVDAAKRNHTVMVASVMFGTGVFGNLLALFVLATSAIEQRRTLFYKLVAGLAVTDLFGTCALSPVVISVYVNNFKWIGGMPVCHYFSFMMIFASFTTLLIVTSMAVERYICVRHPYLYHTRLTATYAKVTLIGSWVLSILIASFPLMGFGKNIYQYPKTWCFFDYLSKDPVNIAFNLFYALIALIAIFVTIICNIVVIYTLIRIRKKQDILNASGGNTRKFKSNNKRYAEIQMVVLLIGITVVFASCYFPLMIYVLLCQTDLVTLMKTDKMGLLLIRFASFNPILDPWVYILFRRELVWKIVNAIKCILRIDQQNIQNVKTPLNEEEPNCCVFCLQCLCEPPNTKANYSVSKPSATLQRSPSERRRLSETLYGNGTVTSKLLIKPPSPADEMVLKSYRNAQTNS